MFGVGMLKLIVIAVIALIVVDPKKLPDLARTLGRGFNEFGKALDGVTDDFKQTLQNDEKPKDDELKDSPWLKQSDAEEF
ncbi:MAG: twin-arginine translocase TatA/TatE family subunit [Smithella sp.]